MVWRMLETSWFNFLGNTENLLFPESDQHWGATTQPGRAYLDAGRIFISCPVLFQLWIELHKNDQEILVAQSIHMLCWQCQLIHLFTVGMCFSLLEEEGLQRSQIEDRFS